MKYNFESTESPDEVINSNSGALISPDIQNLDNLLAEFNGSEDYDSEQKFWASLTSGAEAKYVQAKLMYPSYDDNDLSIAIGLKKSIIRKLNKNQKIQTYIKGKFQERAERYLIQERDSFQKISSTLDKELEHRLHLSSGNNRLDAATLLQQGFSDREARLILENRIEGVSMKDLIRLKMEVPEKVAKLSSITKAEDEGVEVIEEMSILYKKYRTKVAAIDIDKFSPKNQQGFNLTSVQSKKKEKIIDIEVVDNKVSD